MLELTDRHFRYFLRLISRHALLYTEMLTTAAMLRGDRDRLLQFHPFEHPLALQLGGSDPSALAECARIAEGHGFDEVNLNVGCPSERVQSARFGACLMAEPDLVGACVATMAVATVLPVTVKTRIGIDERDSYEELARFIRTVADSGCRTFIVHARKAWLKGLSPKENREIPPLCYHVVQQLKQEFPSLEFVLNGGITSAHDAAVHLQAFDGVMIGRSAYHDPYHWVGVDRMVFHDDSPVRSRHEVLEAFLPYVQEELAKGLRLQAIARHILGLFHGAPGGRLWRRYLSEHAVKPGADTAVLLAAAGLTAAAAGNNLHLRKDIPEARGIMTYS